MGYITRREKDPNFLIFVKTYFQVVKNVKITFWHKIMYSGANFGYLRDTLQNSNFHIFVISGDNILWEKALEVVVVFPGTLPSKIFSRFYANSS